MPVVLITGSCGLVGSQAVRFYCDRDFTVVGIDNDMRKFFFGEAGSTDWNRVQLEQCYPNQYIHHAVDIRDEDAVRAIFSAYGRDLDLIIHAAAQPSHDWAARDPITDFSVNANGTLVLLENVRRFSPNAALIFCSTNKVYGDTPNTLPLIERELRWELEESHPFHDGIDETMTIDRSMHSIFGASKLSADILVQEYGRYFGMKTAVFRGGCLTGSGQSGVELHGFLSYLMKCTMIGSPYVVYGYRGKQVRDNIHSSDLISAFDHFYRAPKAGGVYNMGGGRNSSCSVLEAIRSCEAITGKSLNWTYVDSARSGDHIWWISDTRKFKSEYPAWKLNYSLQNILEEIHSQNAVRWI